ncbi:class I SAM-dependent methyltransferase [Paenibacillus lentus]|uniref:Methyltransferase domain-containing protein n=1 Tax=Paenibacillus lentus TaxID=1338368 RepID=A0A3S8RSP1_9BACL|nr:class I SAM-dependent methyltransferase [Paenibacillus lentus]AZK45969.1 methyltransferase domain-containing protein [Paenibacillus lentus]
MLKYDVSLDENSDNSLSLILRNIKSNSVVLEFGPATGRMTKYLKEKLNCDVYIVEIDPESARIASKYSRDCVIGNIEEYAWLEHFDAIEFDYIVFADVLEHLYQPQKVLLESKRLLKEEGSIFVSIPNVAHNSIIIDLINNRFNYQEIGLLDNTHIRFFTYNSLMKMFEKAFLKPVKSLATYNRPRDTELNNDYDFISNEMLKFLLKNREYGEVYQFIFELKRSSSEELIVRNIRSTPNYYYAQLFINDGNGFNESQTIIQYMNYFDQDLRVAFDLSSFLNIHQLRIDPLNSSCIVKIKNIIINDDFHIKEWATNATKEWDGLLLFDTNDPQILIDTHRFDEVRKLEIVYEIFAYSHDLMTFTSYIADFIDNTVIDNQKKSAYINELESQLSLIKEKADQDEQACALELENKATLFQQQEELLAEKDSVISELTTQLEEIQFELNNVKKDFIAKLSAKEEDVLLLKDQLQDMKQQYDQLGKELNELMNKKGFFQKLKRNN